MNYGSKLSFYMIKTDISLISTEEDSFQQITKYFDSR